MAILSIAALISAFALGHLAALRFRRTAPVLRRGVSALSGRVLPPPLPLLARSDRAGGLDFLALARQRRYEAMGIAAEFIPAGHWRSQ